MAELADAQGLGPCGRESVQVQVLSPAPDKPKASPSPRIARARWESWFFSSGVISAKFTIHLHLHEGNDEEAAKRYWRSETGLDQANFIKTFIKPKGTGHRKNHLPHGICTVRMRKASDSWNIIMEWIDATAVLFGLEKNSH